MRDPDLIWPFSVQALRSRWHKEVVKGGADDPMLVGKEIVATLTDEVDRVRTMLKLAKEWHYEDADHFCGEIMRLRAALGWISKNLGGGKDYVRKAFEAIDQEHEKLARKRSEKKLKKSKKPKKSRRA